MQVLKQNLSNISSHYAMARLTQWTIISSGGYVNAAWVSEHLQL